MVERGGRRKWIQMGHDEINTIIYHVPVGDYNKMCFEDRSTDRVQDALNLFNVLIDKGFMTDKHLISLFTNYDLFLDKIKRVPITVTFTDFPVDTLNPNDPDDVVEFLFDKFKQCLNSKKVELCVPVTLYCMNITNMEKKMKDFLNEMSNEIFDVFLREQMRENEF